MSSVSRLGSLLGAALVAAGCHAPRLDPRRVSDPCAYLTKAEAESVLTVEAKPGDRSEDGAFAVCTYAAAANPRHAVVLRWYLGARGTKFRRSPAVHFDQLRRQAVASRRAQAVDLIGDAAFWVPSTEPTGYDLGTLWVRKGEQIFQITAGAVPGGPQWKMARELARDVLRRF
jgi:hypothetical protein